MGTVRRQLHGADSLLPLLVGLWGSVMSTLQWQAPLPVVYLIIPSSCFFLNHISISSISIFHLESMGINATPLSENILKQKYPQTVFYEDSLMHVLSLCH